METNCKLLDALAGTLIQATKLTRSLAEQALKSLLSQHAKIWIEEDQHSPRTPELIVQILVPAWIDAATAINERLNRHDTTLTNKEIDRIYGVRAPIGSTLKVMGAWIGPNGSLSVVESKVRRAEEIKAYGVS